MIRLRPTALAPAVLAAAWLLALPARAAESADPPAAAQAAPPVTPPAATSGEVRPAPRADALPRSADGAARVRASHRVDVIAPGEKVESVIDRMRSGAAPATRDAAPPPLRPQERGAVRPPGEGPQGTGPPPGGPASQPPPRGEGPPPDRRPR